MTFFHHDGKCAANMHGDDLDVDSPGELHNLERGKKMSLGKSVQTISYGRWSKSKRTSYLDQVIKQSNEFRPGRAYIDPYGATTGNLWSENYEMTRYQKGGQTSLAGRSNSLKFAPLVDRTLDRRQVESSQYVLDQTTQLGGRFVPPLKPVCKRDVGPDPYEVGRGDFWTIDSVGLGRDKSLWQTEFLSRQDTAMVRPAAKPMGVNTGPVRL